MSPEPLRNFEEWQRSVRNFESWLKDSGVPGAMDVDALIERHGNFLIIEGKPWTNGVSLGYGQHLALKALARMENFTVYLLGESDGEKLYIMPYSADADPIFSRKSGRMSAWWKPKSFIPVSMDYLKSLVGEWWSDN